MTQISVASFNKLTPLWTYGGATCTLRLYYTKEFIDSDNNIVLRGTVQNPHQSITCTIASGVITIPPVTLTSTEDGTPSTSTLTGIFFDSTGIQRTTFFWKYRIPVTTPTTWPAIFIHNQPSIVLPDEYYTKVQVELLIDQEIAAATGSFVTLYNNYNNSLATAITEIGVTPTTLIVDKDTNVSTAVVIPSTLILDMRAEAKIVKSGSGTLEFEGMGLSDPESSVAAFSGFLPGNVTFTGTSYPACISSNLWDSAAWGDRLRNACDAFTAQDVEIIVYPGGTPTNQITVKEQQSIYFTRGTYENAIATEPCMVLESNTSLRGDGIGQTNLKESSSAGKVQFVYADGVAVYPYDGFNENITIEHISFIGQPSQTVDSSKSAILLGNCTNGHVRFCEFNDTHGFGAYVGAFATSGYHAERCSITNNIFNDLKTQNAGAIGGKNILIAENIFTNVNMDIGNPLAVAIDVEPNSAEEYAENIQILDNIIDLRDSVVTASGIILQSGGAYEIVKNCRIAGNIIVGCDANDSTRNAVASNGITLAGGEGCVVEDNIVFGMAQGVQIYHSPHAIIRNNYIKFSGGGGIPGLGLISTPTAKIYGNVLEVGAGGGDATVVETESNAVVNTNGTAVTWVSGTLFHPFWAGKTVTINSVDYTVQSTSSLTTLTLTGSAGVQTSVALVTKFSSNEYWGNKRVSMTLLNTSVEYNKATDRRIKGTVTINPANINAGVVSSQNFTLTGALTSDTLLLNPPAAGLTAGLLVLQSFVSASNTITIVFYNTTGGAIDEGGASWDYVLLR